MTLYASTGPGVQADVSPSGAEAMAFEHCHVARLTVPPAHDTLIGPTVIEEGVRVELAHPRRNPGDQRPVLYEFDSSKFSATGARFWLAQRGVTNYTFQPDEQDRAPTTQGSPRDEGERPPPGFTLDEFYSRTIPL